MKKIIIGICCFFIIAFLVFWLHVERTDWVLKEKEYNLNIPLKNTNETIVEIEEQVKKVIPSKYSDAQLSEIKFISKSKEGFETFEDGELEFVYCNNLGDLYGFYEYDRFALCKIGVNLKQKLITNMTIYGNNQVNGLRKIETYPDINQIRETIWTYCENKSLFIGGYTIVGCFIDVIDTDTIMSSFTVNLTNETQKQIYGKIINLNGDFLFIENN